MNTEYATKEGYAIFTGDVTRAYEISKWCKDRNLVHEVDYKYHCRRKPYLSIGERNSTKPFSEIVFQFKDPRQATIALLKWT